MKMILATDKNMMIAKDGYMPWRSKEDLSLFKKITNGNNIIMGKTTFETLPKRLENRQYFVLTRNKEYCENEKIKESEAIVINDIELLHKDFNKKYNNVNLLQCDLEKIQNADNFIIGGAEIYKEFLERNIVDKIFWSAMNVEVESNDSSIYCDFFKFMKGKFNEVNKVKYCDFTLYELEREK